MLLQFHFFDVLLLAVLFVMFALMMYTTMVGRLSRNQRGGVALELLCGQATAPDTTQTGITMGAGNSLTTRNCPFDKKVLLLQAWTDVQLAGKLRIKSPKMHDNVQGLRFDTIASDATPLMPYGYGQKLIPQDVLTVDISGSATGGDLEGVAMLVYYEDLPGTAARLAKWDQVQKQAVNVLSVENTLSLGTTGGYTGEEAINAEFDLLKANTDYALIGYIVDTECLAVRWRGADTGNLGVGGPGIETSREITSSWFSDLSRAFDMPLIPVFNSANKSGLLVDGVQDENGADTTVNMILAELGPTSAAR